jgi:hypothetical protein
MGNGSPMIVVQVAARTGDAGQQSWRPFVDLPDNFSV